MEVVARRVANLETLPAIRRMRILRAQIGEKNKRRLTTAAAWLRDHVVVVLLVTAVGAWAVEVYERPSLTIAHGVGSVRWLTWEEGDSVIAETAVWDMSTGAPFARQTMVDDQGGLVPFGPEHGGIIKFVLQNTSDKPITNLRLPIDIGARRTGRLSSTPNVEAELAERDAGYQVDVILVPLVPPRTESVVTYEFTIEQSALDRLFRQGLHFSFPKGASRELGSDHSYAGIRPFSEVLFKEGGLRSDGALFLTHRSVFTSRGRPQLPMTLQFMTDTASEGYRRMVLAPHLAIR